MKAKYCTYPDSYLSRIHGITLIFSTNKSPGLDPPFASSADPCSSLETCYVASAGVTELVYSGYKPHAYSWDSFPPLKDILEAVHKAILGSSFNSLLLNRYKGGDDYVGWHADDEKLYGPTLEIASVSFGCERDFLLKKRPIKTSKAKRTEGEPPSKRPKKNVYPDQHSFVLKHGSLLLMRGYTQRGFTLYLNAQRLSLCGLILPSDVFSS